MRPRPSSSTGAGPILCSTRHVRDAIPYNCRIILTACRISPPYKVGGTTPHRLRVPTLRGDEEIICGLTPTCPRSLFPGSRPPPPNVCCPAPCWLAACWCPLAPGPPPAPSAVAPAFPLFKGRTCSSRCLTSEPVDETETCELDRSISWGPASAPLLHRGPPVEEVA